MAHLFHQNGSGILVQHLIDSDHGAHLHQLLDHLRCLHRHPLRQLGDRDGLRNGDFPNHRPDRFFEAVLRCGRLDGHPTCLLAARRLLGLATLLGEPQPIRLFPLFGWTRCRFAFLLLFRQFLLALALLLFGGRRLHDRRRCCSDLDRLLLLFFRLSGRLLFCPPTLLFLATRLLFPTTRLFSSLPLGPLPFQAATLLLHHHAALHVGPLFPHFDGNRLGRGAPPLAEFDLADALPLQRHLFGRTRLLGGTMLTAQIGKQFALVFVTDEAVGLHRGDTGLLELLEKPLDRDAHRLGKFLDTHFSHWSPPSIPAPARQTRVPAPS